MKIIGTALAAVVARPIVNLLTFMTRGVRPQPIVRVLTFMITGEVAQPIVGESFLMIRHGRAVGKRMDDMQLC